MTNLTEWVLLFPLLGFVLLGIFGRGMSRPAVLVIAWGAAGLAFLFAAISFLSMLQTPAGTARLSDLVLYTWANTGSVATGVLPNAVPLNISFGLLLDPLSATMLMVVTGVGFLIHIYSAGYMADDEGFARFFAYLNFFIFAMVLLVSADNFLFLLVGWAL
ncbi:MAG: NADH-quinone oxidoreductase subunit L, partial [Ktedonobacteraceae bacterium]